MGKIPLFKVFMAPEAPAMVAETLRSGFVTQGPRVEEFERELQILMRLDEPPLAVSTCTHGLDLIWHLLGIGAGDEVVSTPMTCTATNGQLVTRGARIVWADVDPVTGLIEPMDAALKVTRRTKAIVAVDWGGRLCDYDALCRIGPPVVQDAAHSLLAEAQPGARRFAHYTAWSFQAIKHLTCCDGGAIQVPRDQVERARLLRWYGFDRRASTSFRCGQLLDEVGYKYHMNDVAATVGLANVRHAAEVVAKHRANAAEYWEAFKDMGWGRLRPPPPDAGSSWWIYCMVLPFRRQRRRDLVEHFSALGIESSPVHQRNDFHPAMRFGGGPLRGVDRFGEGELAIPVGWWLSEEDRRRVVEAVYAWRDRGSKT